MGRLKSARFFPGPLAQERPLNWSSLLSFLFVLLFALSFAGCSQTSQQPSDASTVEERNFVTVQSEEGLGDDMPTDPVEVDILEEIFDGEKLSLVLQITPTQDINSKQLAARLVFFIEGQGVGESEYPVFQLRAVDSLKPIGEQQLRRGVARKLLLQSRVPSESTDYQIEVAWKPASALIASEQAEILQGTQVRERQMVCTELCFIPFDMRLKLYNPFSQPITALSFSTWFQSPEQEVPTEKGTLPLGGQTIGPRETLIVTVQLKTPLPYELYEKGYRPVAEFRSFEFEKKSR